MFFKTYWRRFENVFKTSWRRLEDVLKTFLQDVLKTSWKRLEDVLKTHSQDVRLRRTYSSWSRRFEDVFIKTNVCWAHTIYLSSVRVHTICLFFHDSTYYCLFSVIAHTICLFSVIAHTISLFSMIKDKKAAAQTCSVTKVFLEISQENICARDSFLIKLQAWGLQLY